MKKLLFLFSAVMMLALVSCDGKGKQAEQIFAKIEADEELSQNDYHFMIEYVEDALEDAVKVLKQDPDLTKVQEKLTKINEKYPFTQPFTAYLLSHSYLLDKENLDELSEVQEKLQQMLQ